MSPQFLDEIVLDLIRELVRLKEKTIKRPCLRCRQPHKGTNAEIIVINGYAS